ncbi:MAG: hypothetical protein AAGE52_14575, partial [Myxococcota bacterium]
MRRKLAWIAFGGIVLLTAAPWLAPVLRPGEIKAAERAALWQESSDAPASRFDCRKVHAACFADNNEDCRAIAFGGCTNEVIARLRAEALQRYLSDKPEEVISLVTQLEVRDPHRFVVEEALSSPRLSAHAIPDWPIPQSDLSRTIASNTAYALDALRYEPVSLVAHHHLFNRYRRDCTSPVDCLRGVRKHSRTPRFAFFSRRTLRFAEATEETRTRAPDVVLEWMIPHFQDLAIDLAIRIRRAREHRCDAFAALGISP